MKVLAIIFDGFEEEEAMAPFALLKRAKIELDIASSNITARGSHNLYLTNLKLIDEINYKNYDMLLLPGGAHWRLLEQSSFVLNAIKYFMDNNKVVGAICAAPTILGRMGYLKNKNYTCFTSMNDDFGGNYIDKKVVVDGNLITARSVASAIVFAYAIIEKLLGKEALNKIKEQIYEKED